MDHTLDTRRRGANLRWGLLRGLLSGLLTTTSGALEVPTGAWPPTEDLALFTLWASVSTSLQDEDKWAAPLEEVKEMKGKAEAYSSFSSSSSSVAFLFLSEL